MKKFKLISLLLIFTLIGLTFTACKDKNDEPNDIPTAAELIGSVWKGVNQNTGYSVEVSIFSDNKCKVAIAFEDYSYIEDCTCYYNETSGQFTCVFENYKYEGFIKGDIMQLTIAEYGTFSLSRLK